MKSSIVLHLIVSLLCVPLSNCATKTSLDHRRDIGRQGRIDDEPVTAASAAAAVEDEDYDESLVPSSSLEDATDGTEGTDAKDGTDQRFHHHHNQNHHPLHLFMKKKRPFVSFSTKTETATVTTTVTSTTIGLCAQLVNVTGACRLRRGLWVEDPIVMSFDDDMDAIDGALLPSATLRIETTASPSLKSESRKEAIELMDDGKYLAGSVIQPSTTSTLTGDPLDDDDEENQQSAGQRIGLKKIFALKNVFKKKIKLHLITVVTTSISSVTSTSTAYVTLSTKTFFIQLCTPSPFPFDICPSKKKKRELEMLQLNASQSQSKAIT